MIIVVHAAPLLTVQDLGRHGFRHLGVPRCGVMDAPALQKANLLLQNDPGAAGLEISTGPVTLQSTERHWIVLLGAEMSAQIVAADNKTLIQEHVYPGFVTQLPAGNLLKLDGPAIPGHRGVLAIAGGIDVPAVLGSRSTDLNNGFGGYDGRALRAGDQLNVGPHEHANAGLNTGLKTGAKTRPRPGHIKGVRQTAPILQFRVIRGPDWDLFTRPALTEFLSRRWRVEALSNRMGVRLHGYPLDVPASATRLSAGVLPGQIQIPPDGQPIILANDAQTIGGYSCPASVIQADLWQLAYLSAAMEITFTEVSIAEAQGLLAAQVNDLHQLQRSIQSLYAS